MEAKQFVLVYFESNTIIISSNTWWMDKGASFHISMTLEEFKQ